MQMVDPLVRNILRRLDDYFRVNMTNRRFAMLVIIPFVPRILYKTRDGLQNLKARIEWLQEEERWVESFVADAERKANSSSTQ
ncbi:hypothetical protein Tsubulata_035316 [Turnera subulata]|uniref:Uncharacterized protein n=1 Tax=Turnera subulata TaxID=218843 RepID=A0A9Q0JGC3_9ROSI|nr:hypothetical protein Tsubulata_035316 [Turnera subulata]